MQTKLVILFLFTLAAITGSIPINVAKTEVPLGNWSGYGWVIRDGTGNPGPNTFLKENAWLENGELRLLISKNGGCADVVSNSSLGYGEYLFTIRVPDGFDPTAVAGMFSCGNIDFANEIDIELTRWSYPVGDIVHYTSYPSVANAVKYAYSPPIKELGTVSTHRYIWTKNKVEFISQAGRKDIDDLTDITGRGTTNISPSEDMPVHFIAWMMTNRDPTRDMMFVIERFEYRKT
jgi:hypothetical protein